MDNIIRYTVDKKDSGMRLNEYLKEAEGLSSRFIRCSTREGRIEVNDEKARLKTKVLSGDVISIKLNKEENQNIKPEKMDLEIIYEDMDIIAINKKPGIVVHPTKGHPTGTLANGVLHHFKEQGDTSIVRLINRLDMDTSGIVLIGKNQFTHMSLARDMSKGLVEKKYIAIVRGNLTEKEGVINAPIYREEHNLRRIVDERGQKSITHYKVIERYTKGDLVKLKLETGRTHQIRVHLSYLGNAILGDTLYGDNQEYIERQALHAYKLKFPHPRSGSFIELKAPIPKDMEQLLDKLREE